MRFHFVVAFLGGTAGVTGFLKGPGGAAFGVHIAGENEELAISGNSLARSFGCEAGDLRGTGAIGVHPPNLRGTTFSAGVVEALAIGRPPGAFGRFCEADGIATFEGHRPDAADGPVCGNVRRTDGERNGLAIRG